MLAHRSYRLTARLLLFFFAAVALLHVLALAGLLPADILWGGRLQDRNQLLVFETVSLLLNLLMAAVVAGWAGWCLLPVRRPVLRGLLWAMAALFALNTVGNLLAESRLETLLFTPLTLLAAAGCLFLARGE
ncbi:MAG TPA: hypothetical protein PKE07_15190 [Lacibacter sp.]|nr:hypothetical protein [Lacibacter sp.]HMO90526.1 hypothetical protein [Lacibacter sp.]